MFPFHNFGTHTHTHPLEFTAAAFIMPIDFNYCPSDLAQQACFQAAEPEKSSFAAKPWKSWPHSSILGEKPVPFFVFWFFLDFCQGSAGLSRLG